MAVWCPKFCVWKFRQKNIFIFTPNDVVVLRLQCLVFSMNYKSSEYKKAIKTTQSEVKQNVKEKFLLFFANANTEDVNVQLLPNLQRMSHMEAQLLTWTFNASIEIVSLVLITKTQEIEIIVVE